MTHAAHGHGELARLCREYRLHLAPHGDLVRAWPHGALWHVDGADHLDAARKAEERFNSL